jgi:hypothetical protein
MFIEDPAAAPLRDSSGGSHPAREIVDLVGSFGGPRPIRTADLTLIRGAL